MSKIKELLEQGRKEELWQMCCGFIDLSLEQFMDIQKRLLLEQIELLKNCDLGKKVMRGAMPETIEEFREQVPLTTYADYCPELLEQREDVLPVKPSCWVRTSGRSGEYTCKWIPISNQFWEEMGPVFGGAMIFGTCRERGDIIFDDNFKFLYAIAPEPYTFGMFARKLVDDFGFKFLPSLHEAEQMSFEERLEVGLKMALSEGVDGFYGLPGVLMAISERFKEGSSSMKLSDLLSQPRMVIRLLKGFIKSKITHRPMLPKDLWKVKLISAAGTDGVIYSEKIKDMWGRHPLDGYGGTEAIIAATQTWDYEGMTFFPTLNFFEFIPEDEYAKWKLDNSYQPKTILLDEVKAGNIYELVITNFHGNALARYRIGDMIRITSLRNDKLNIDIPQMVFERRADDLIDLGLMRLTEKVIWQAVESTGVPYQDWTARKEIIGDKSTLHLYIELKDKYNADEKDLAAAVYEQLKGMNDGFIHQDLASVEKLIELEPIKVTTLPAGSFTNYIAQRRAEGADLAHIKPCHINPSDKVLSLLGVEMETVFEEAVVAEFKPEVAVSQ